MWGGGGYGIRDVVRCEWGMNENDKDITNGVLRNAKCKMIGRRLLTTRL